MFHLIHDWEIVGADKYVVGKGFPMTFVRYRCTVCRTVRTDQIEGHWDVEDLQ